MSYLNGIIKNPGIIFAREISKKYPVSLQVMVYCLFCFGGKIQTEKAADQLSELLFLARKTKLSRLTTFFASTATTLFYYWAERAGLVCSLPVRAG